MRSFSFITLLSLLLVFDLTTASAQVVLYPNGKRVKILSSRSGANQLAGNQQRFIINQDREVIVDPKKRELDEAQARARFAYPNEEDSELEIEEDQDTQQTVER